MAKKTAGWQNPKVPLLNCLRNDVKLRIIKPAWFVGKFPVVTFSLKSYFTKEHFGWLITGSAPITGGPVRHRESGVSVPEDIVLVGIW
jgi:hypothetical protein